MINIIREDSSFNPELTCFPAATANVAIFGTQSSGKSTLLNAVFGTTFPVLDTRVTRQRCTKGIWMQSVSGFNVIDTEGFDSEERAGSKMLEKQVALFCLALADVLVINVWMNEIGRYEASHSHILKAIIHASEKVIASQQRRLIFAVRDCTQDADRNILRSELNSHLMSIIESETQNSTLRFSLEYVMMSHPEDQEKQFREQAQELLHLANTTRKSTLNNYNNEDRLIYISKLWQQVTSSQSEVDLRTAEDALRDYALERIKKETTAHMEEWINSVSDLLKFKTYTRFKEAAWKECRTFYLNSKPKHLKENEVESYIEAINQAIEIKLNRHFMVVLLPSEEDRLVEHEYQGKLDAVQNADQSEFKRSMTRKRKQLEQAYKIIVKGLREHEILTKRFSQKLDSKNIKYEQFLQHLQNLFKTDLEAALNSQADTQTKRLLFSKEKINKVITQQEQLHKSDASDHIAAIWERVIYRTSNSTLVERLRAEGEAFSTSGLGALAGNQSQQIIAHYRELQQRAESYLSGVLSFGQPEEELTMRKLQNYEAIRRLITSLIDVKLIQEARRFKVSLFFIAILMFFFYSEFKFCMRSLGVSKKKLRKWVFLYTMTMLGSFGILAFRNRDYLRKFIILKE